MAEKDNGIKPLLDSIKSGDVVGIGRFFLAIVDAESQERQAASLELRQKLANAESEKAGIEPETQQLQTWLESAPDYVRTANPGILQPAQARFDVLRGQQAALNGQILDLNGNIQGINRDGKILTTINTRIQKATEQQDPPITRTTLARIVTFAQSLLGITPPQAESEDLLKFGAKVALQQADEPTLNKPFGNITVDHLPRPKTPTQPNQSLFLKTLRDLQIELPDTLAPNHVSRSWQAAMAKAQLDTNNPQIVRQFLTDGSLGLLDKDLLTKGEAKTPFGNLVDYLAQGKSPLKPESPDVVGTILVPGKPAQITVEPKKRVNSALHKPADAPTIHVVQIFSNQGINLKELGIHHPALVNGAKEAGIKAGIVTDHTSLNDALNLLANGDLEIAQTLIANAQGEKSRSLLEKLVAAIQKNKSVKQPEAPTPVNAAPAQTEPDFSRRPVNPYPALSALLTMDEQRRFKVDGRHSLTQRFMEIQGKKHTIRPRGEQGSKRQKADIEETQATRSLSDELNSLDQLGAKHLTIDAMLKKESAAIPMDLQRQIRWAQLADLPPAALRHLTILIADKSVRPTSPSELKTAIIKRLNKRP